MVVVAILHSSQIGFSYLKILLVRGGYSYHYIFSTVAFFVLIRRGDNSGQIGESNISSVCPLSTVQCVLEKL